MFCQLNEEDNSPVNSQLWVDFYPHFYVAEKFEYYGDTGYHTSLEDNLWNWIYMRPSMRYHLNELLELHGGIGFFYIYEEIISNRFEIRPWQGLQLNWPNFEKFRIKNLLKLEERIYYLTEDWSSSFELRLRYKISGRWDISKFNRYRFLYIPMYIEVFIPVADDIVEIFRNRGRAGIGL